MTSSSATSSHTPHASTVEANKHLVKRFVEHGYPSAVQGHPDVLHDYVHDDFVNHTGHKHDHEHDGLEGLKAETQQFAKAMVGTDLRTRVDMMIAEGDQVWVHWHAEGKHTGRGKHHHLGHIEATHDDLAVSGILLYKLRDGKIAEGWRYSNVTEVLLAKRAAAAAK